MATYIELQKQIEALQKEAEALKSQERDGVVARMKEAIQVYGITAEDLGLRRTRGPGTGRKTTPKSNGGGKKSSGTPAYQDASGNTWGGRGPRPQWLRDALGKGAKLEDFATTQK